MGNCNPSSIKFIQIGVYEYSTTQIIGKGPHGTVYKGYTMLDKRVPLAIKCLDKSFTQSEYNAIRPVLNQLRAFDGPNVAKLVDYFYDDSSSKLYMISEYCAYGNLNDLILGMLKTDPVEDLRVAVGYCQQIIKGLLALHDGNIIHGKLTAKNVLFHSSKLKINDYGLETITQSNGKTPQKAGMFVAPELLEDGAEPTKKADIWALGLIMYILIYKSNPLKIIGQEYIIYNLQKGKCAKLDDLVSRCLVRDPSERISPDELRDHPLLQMNPQSINNLERKWSNQGENTGSNSQAATKMFHEMEINFSFATN